MQLIEVRRVTDRYNTRFPAKHLDLLGIKEGDLIEIITDERQVIARKVHKVQEATI